MKGLIVSFGIFLLFGVSSILCSHWFRPQRHSEFFQRLILIWSPLYFIIYFVTPADLYVIPQSWLASHQWLDVLYGFIVFLLNGHSFIDVFFALCGGFSSSLLLEILRAGPQGITTEDLISRYIDQKGNDKIYAWRIPHLLKKGYMILSESSQTCHLSFKGTMIAHITRLCKKAMNLDKGG